MKKRAIIILLTSLLMVGCGGASENKAQLPSEATVYEDSGTSEDSTIGVDDGATEGIPDSSMSNETPGGSDSDNDPSSTDGSYVSDNDDLGSGSTTTGGSYGDDDDDSTPGGSVSSPRSTGGGAGSYVGDADDAGDDTDAEGGSEVSPASNNTEVTDDSDDADESANTAGNDTKPEGENSDDSADKQAKENQGYGRIFFIGDSRTVDMFDGNAEEIYDYNAGGIRVFAKDGCHCAYMQDVTGKYAGEFDTIVSWLGCNDNNDAALYQQVYESLISQGKTVVLCTVGPTADEFLSGDFDVANYPNEKMLAFNQSMVSWANARGVKVIDTYSFVQGNIEISPDGIHYNPKPTTAIWNYILGNL